MLHPSIRVAPIPSTTLARKPSHGGLHSKHIKRHVLTKNDNQQQRRLENVDVQQSYACSNQSNATESIYTAPLNVAPMSSSTTSTDITKLKQSGTNTTTENVQVAVRCRPLSTKETTIAWDIDTSQAKIHLTDDAAAARRPQQQQHQQQRQQKPPTNKEYYFDNVAYGSDNNALYQSSVKPLIGQAMDGYNATVFAYGQTASGKTYTMMGTESDPGIIPRAVDEIFSYIKTATDQEFLLRVSYLEIYNETIRDLLEPENTSLKVHENKKRGIYVTPMREEVVTCGRDVLHVIQRGEANRHISTTDYNLHSSRSHTIFQMVIESRQRSRENISTSTRTLLNTKNAKESVKISQLNLIDLAGSEKAASDHDRRKEGAYINKSLLTLGTVISKLTASGKSVGHVPYRDSKLTRILQPSLSGHAKVVVICTISPHMSAVDESVNTLKFATRVKKVVLSAKNDAVMDDKTLLQQYRGEITELKLKLKTANDVLVEEQQSKQSMITAERQQFEEELFQMRVVRNALKERIDHLTKMILTSTSVAMPSVVEDSNTTGDPTANSTQNNDQPGNDSVVNSPHVTVTDDATNNPWTLVHTLRHEIQGLRLEIQELRQNNENLHNQLNHHQLE